MLELVIYILCAYGISNILVFADGPFRIFERYREWTETLPSNIGEGSRCMICTPCQVGIALSIIDLLLTSVSFTPFNVLFHNPSLWYLIIPLDGAITSGSVWLIHTLQEALEGLVNDEEDGE